MNKQKTTKSRLLAMLLSVCMVFSMMPVSAFAADETVGTGSLPACHTQHDDTCGYVAAVEGQPCTHEHDESCGYVEAAEGVEDQPCTHVHDEVCGYVEAVEGQPCTHTCEECTPIDSGETADTVKCICDALCTEDAVNEECPVCKENAANCTFEVRAEETAAKETAYEKVVALFETLPDASVITAESTDEEKETLYNQLGDAMTAYEALTKEERAKFEDEHADLLAAALALNEAITGKVPATMSVMAADDLIAAITAAPDGGTVELTGDVTLSSTIIVTKDLKITSGTGGPYTITRGSGFTSWLFAENAAGKTLKFENVIIDGAKDSVTAAKPLLLANAGGIALNSGAIVQNNNNASAAGGAASTTANGTLTMNGGTIKNCTAAAGGAVSNAGVFTMNESSTIQNCSAGYGGGVYAGGSSRVNICGGKITGCSSTSSYGGGGIYINTSAYFNMTDGSITENTAYGAGGGIFAGTFASEDTTFTITGGTISNNKSTSSNGGGIAISKRNASIFGATISGNTAYAGGGGLYHKGDSATDYTLTLSDTMISKNTSEYQDDSGYGGGGLYEAAYGKLYISGLTNVTENVAHSDGGGIYIAAYASAELNGTDENPVIISKNRAYGWSGLNENFGGGGGIYGCSDGLLKLIGVISITENKTDSFGGGINGWTNYLNNGLKIEMSGKITIKDNIEISTNDGGDSSNLLVSVPMTLLDTGLAEGSCIGIITLDDPCKTVDTSGSLVSPGHDVPFTTTETDTALYAADRDYFFSDKNYPIGADGDTGKCIYVMPPVEETVLSGDDAEVTYGSISGSLIVSYTESDDRCAYSQQWYEGSSADASKLISGQTGKAFTIPADLDARSYTYTVRVTADLNYSSTSVYSDKTFTVAVAQAPLTISEATATNRPYNGKDTVTISGGTLVGVIAGDVGKVQLGGAPIGHISDVNKGDGKPVTVTGYALGGDRAGNYTLSQPAGITVNITAAPIIIQWQNLTTIYNGAVQYATVSDFTGKVGNEAVSITVEGKENAGSYTVTAALEGADIDNYTLSNPTNSFIIQRAPVTFAVTDNSHKADGNTHMATVTANTDSANYSITYKLNGVAVAAPAKVGDYDIYAEITNNNFRHNDAADGSIRKIGVLTIYAEIAPATYTVTFNTDGGSDVAALDAAISGTVRTLPAAPTKAGFIFSGWKYGSKVYQAGASFTQPASDVSFTALWTANTFKISGVVDQNGDPIEGAVVTLTLGSKQIAQTTTDATGKYSFSNIANGLYNLRAEWNGIIQTIAVEIASASMENQNIVLPMGKTNSVVDVAAGTPDVVVAALEETFDDTTIYTETDKNEVVNGGTVEIRADVQVSTDAAGQAAIENKLKDEESVALFMDIDLSKIVKNAAGAVQSKTPIYETAQILSFTIFLPAELQGKANYVVYRQHNGDVQQITTTAVDGEYIEVNSDGTEIVVHVKKFSVYGIGYAAAEITFDANGGTCDTATQLTDSEGKLTSLPAATRTGSYHFDGWFTAANGGTEITPTYVFTGNTTVYAHWTYTGGGGGGGSSTTYYTITTDAGAGGSFDTAKTVSVRAGESAGFTITANKGYVIADVKVDGKSVGAVSSYTFTNVRSNHTISATFTRGDHTNPQTGVELNTTDHFAYMVGYSNGTFGAERNITRAEVTVMFSRLLTEQMDRNTTYTSTFTDISGSEWYANAVGYMAQLGIITGYSDGTFGGNKPITRAEFSVIASRFDELAEGAQNSFFDVADSHWAKNYIASAAEKGWVSGYSDGTFKPENYITRAEVVTIVNRMLGRNCDAAYVTENADSIKHFSDLTADYWAYYQICEAANAHNYEKANGVETWTSL